MKQKRSQEKKILTRLAAIVMGAILMGFSAYAKEVENFKKPSLDGFWHYGDVSVDKDKDGVKESVISFYKNSQGDKILKTRTNNQIWKWGEKSHNYPQDKDNITKNYIIIDTDCDGKFDAKHNLESVDSIPSCLK